MPRYAGYEISGESIDLAVDTDKAALWDRLIADLRIAQEDGAVDLLILGEIDAESVDAALNKIRADEWVPGSKVLLQSPSPVEEST